MIKKRYGRGEGGYVDHAGINIGSRKEARCASNRGRVGEATGLASTHTLGSAITTPQDTSDKHTTGVNRSWGPSGT